MKKIKMGETLCLAEEGLRSMLELTAGSDKIRELNFGDYPMTQFTASSSSRRLTFEGQVEIQGARRHFYSEIYLEKVKVDGWVIDHGIISAVDLDFIKGEVASSKVLSETHFCWRNQEGERIGEPRKMKPFVSTGISDSWPDKLPSENELLPMY